MTTKTKRRNLLTIEEIKGCWAIMPTPATPDASNWRQSDTADLDETARVVNALIVAGVDGILTLGTLGECAALSWEEKRAFMATAVEAASGRVPIFGGTTSLNTRETIRQTREARDLGIDGTMLGPSMWNKPDVDGAVRFYRDVAEAVPEMAICVYVNPYVFKFDFPPPFWAQVCDIPQIVMAKTAGAATLLTDVRASRGRIRMLPIEAEYYGAARLDPDHSIAFWSSGACCGPAPAIALRDFVAKAKTSGDWSKAKQLSEELRAATLPIICYGDFNEFQMHNVALEKGRMNQAGWLHAGPNRPPYQCIPEKIRLYAESGGKMWAELQKKYSQTPAT
jgi:trans-o-hydroxybenzylidenepyruvate hydratase-aldolase